MENLAAAVGPKHNQVEFGPGQSIGDLPFEHLIGARGADQPIAACAPIAAPPAPRPRPLHLHPPARPGQDPGFASANQVRAALDQALNGIQRIG